MDGIRVGSGCQFDDVSLGTVTLQGILTHDHWGANASSLQYAAETQSSASYFLARQYDWINVEGYGGSRYVRFPDIVANITYPTTGTLLIGGNFQNIAQPVSTGAATSPSRRVYNPFIPGLYPTTPLLRHAQLVVQSGRILHEGSTFYFVDNGCYINSATNQPETGSPETCQAPGDSGAGLFDYRGNLIGVYRGYYPLVGGLLNLISSAYPPYFQATSFPAYAKTR